MRFAATRFLSTILLLLSATSVPALPPPAAEVMQSNLSATKISGFMGELTMTLVNKDGDKRVRRMGVRSKLRANGVDSAVLTRFLQPADIKGTGFLQLENSAGDDDIWVYLPGLAKTRRLAANNKRDSFFGTDFSYGDILLPPVGRYSHVFVREEAVDGSNCFVIESTPKETRTRDETGYSRKLTWVDARSFVERKVEYYDLDNALLKTQLTFDVQLVEPDKQRWMPMRRQMTNHQTGHQTLYQFDRFEVQASLKDGEFTTRRLEDG
jgi:outer membrane lipoprotein-sorting protein